MTSPALLPLAALALAACIEPAHDRSGVTGKRASFDRADAAPFLVASAQPERPVRATFGGAVQLLGYDLTPPKIVPGQPVRVTLYFKCLDELPSDWRVFVHLDDPAGRAPRINADHDVAGGRFPLDAWKRGDVVRDAFAFVPTTDAAALDLWLGFYRGDDRLPVDAASLDGARTDGQNRVLAGALTVR